MVFPELLTPCGPWQLKRFRHVIAGVQKETHGKPLSHRMLTDAKCQDVQFGYRRVPEKGLNPFVSSILKLQPWVPLILARLAHLFDLSPSLCWFPSFSLPTSNQLNCLRVPKLRQSKGQLSSWTPRAADLFGVRCPFAGELCRSLRHSVPRFGGVRREGPKNFRGSIIWRIVGARVFQGFGFRETCARRLEPRRDTVKTCEEEVYNSDPSYKSGTDSSIPPRVAQRFN